MKHVPPLNPIIESFKILAQNEKKKSFQHHKLGWIFLFCSCASAAERAVSFSIFANSTKLLLLLLYPHHVYPAARVRYGFNGLSFSLFECVCCVGVSDHSIHLSPKSSEFFLFLPFLFWMHTSTREAHTYVPESHSTSVYTTARIREWSSNKTLIPSHPNSLESFPSLYISFPWISCSTLLDIHNVILDPRSFFASKNGKKMEKK